MDYIDNFRDPAKAKALLSAIAHEVDAIGATAENPVRIMEICGGHTHAIFRYGLDKMVAKGLEFIHGLAVRCASCPWRGWMKPSGSPISQM